MAKLKTAVLGATGYSGLELTRILARHPRLDPPLLLRRSVETREHSHTPEIFPHVAGNGHLPVSYTHLTLPTNREV